MFLQDPDSNSAGRGHHGMRANYMTVEPFIAQFCSLTLSQQCFGTTWTPNLGRKSVAVDRGMRPFFDDYAAIAIEGNGCFACQQTTNC